MNDQQIEREIQAKGLTAPRVTPQDIEAWLLMGYALKQRLHEQSEG